MKDVTIRWEIDLRRDDGQAMDISEVAHVEIFTSLDPATFGYTSVGKFTPDVSQTVLQSLEGGTWYFRGVVEDTQGKRSVPKDVSIEIPKSAPAGLATLTVEVV